MYMECCSFRENLTPYFIGDPLPELFSPLLGTVLLVGLNVVLR